MRVLAAAVVTIVLALGPLAGAGPAAAHATRIAEDPAENAELTRSPASASATFNEEMSPQFAAMTVVGPDGNLWSTGAPRVQDAVISVDVRPLGPSGTYTVNYRATSADGHVVNGSWSFRLTVAGSGAPGPPASTPASPPPADDGGLPVWPFYLGAALIVGAAAVWAVRRRS